MSEKQQQDIEAEEANSVMMDKQEKKTSHQFRFTADKQGLKRGDNANTSKVDLKNTRRKQSQSNIFEKVKHSDSTEKFKHNEKKTSLTAKANSPESLPMASMETKQKKATAIPEQLAQVTPMQPTLTDIEPASASQEKPAESKTPVKLDTKKLEAEAEEGSVDKITELRTQPKFSEWSDEEEAGGLSRSSSRASRVSRAVRQLFCCGVAYEAPDEDNVSYHRAYAI